MVRTYLSAAPYDDDADRLAADTVLAAAKTMSNPADLINRAVEALQAAFTDLPAFGTLDRMEVGDVLDIAQPARQHTLLLALLRQASTRCRDELVEMLLRRVRRTHAAAKERLEDLQERHREIEEVLIGVFGQVLKTAQDGDAADAALGSPDGLLKTAR